MDDTSKMKGSWLSKWDLSVLKGQICSAYTTILHPFEGIDDLTMSSCMWLIAVSRRVFAKKRPLENYEAIIDHLSSWYK